MNFKINIQVNEMKKQNVKKTSRLLSAIATRPTSHN